jgi:putative heme-binding domain-containing protein
VLNRNDARVVSLSPPTISPSMLRRLSFTLILLACFCTDGTGQDQRESHLPASRPEFSDESPSAERTSRQWKLEDLEPELVELDRGRSFATGKRMFGIAKCNACHRMDGQGQEFGPDLAKLDLDKFTPHEILRHVLEPSAEINKDHQTYVVELESGQIITGLVIAEGTDSLKVVENPLSSTQPRSIRFDEIVDRTKSPKSIMPEGLLDKLSRDEILDLIGYIRARGNDHDPLYRGDDEDGLP